MSSSGTPRWGRDEGPWGISVPTGKYGDPTTTTLFQVQKDMETTLGHVPSNYRRNVAMKSGERRFNKRGLQMLDYHIWSLYHVYPHVRAIDGLVRLVDRL